jgi:hypothetical protein
MPEDEPLSPALASKVYGALPTIQSTAPDGLYAFAETLHRLEYEVRLHRQATLPNRGVLVLLSPRDELLAEEKDQLERWVRNGGRLLLVDAEGSRPDPWEQVGLGDEEDDAPASNAPTDDAAGDSDADSDSDADAASENGFPGSAAGASAAADAGWLTGRALVETDTGRVEQVGAGLVARPQSSSVLSNGYLRAQGLAPSLPWLRPLLQDRHRVLVDEVRLGTMSRESPLRHLWSSSYGPAAGFGLLALLLWLMARGMRRQPAQPDPPAGGRDFGEHLNAVAEVLHHRRRLRAAETLLLEGVRRRLGPLVHRSAIRGVLAEIESAPATDETELVRHAERLRQLDAGDVD